MAAILALALNLAAAGIGDAADRPFDLFAFFDGKARSEGVVDPLIGKAERFTARFEGEAKGDRLRLVEVFAFPDGEFDQIWELRREGTAISGTVRTESEDGELSDPVSVTGQLSSDGAMLTYDGYAPGGGDTLFAFTHRMTARPDGTVRNDVTVAKFLLPLARSTVTFFPDGR